MGFSSTDDFVNKVTQLGQFHRIDWNKLTSASVFTAGRWYDFSQFTGIPAANAYSGSALTATQCVDASWGLYHGGNCSPDTKHLINMSGVTPISTGVPAVLMLVDMLMYYPSISLTTSSAQTLTNSSSLPRYTSGAGVRAFLSATTAPGTNSATMQMSYTNQAGTSGRTMPVTVALTASSLVGHLVHSGTSTNQYGPFLPLQAGDTGIQSVQSVTISTPHTTGAASLVLCRPIANIPLTTTSVMSERDLMNMLPSLPRIYDGASLAWLYFAGSATAASTNFYGSCDFAWG